MSDSTTQPEVVKTEAEIVQPAVADKELNVAMTDAANEEVKTEETKTEETETKTEETKTEEVTAAAESKISKDPENMLKTTAQANADKKGNNKFDPSVLPDSDDALEIRNQVHFYFSDANLPTDKFLWQQTGGPENKPVALDKICSFKRMRRFKPRTAVVAALKDSRFLNIEGEEGEEQITRKHPYKPIQGKNFKSSVYIKGFGDEEPSTQFDIEAFLTKIQPFTSVRLRRNDDNLFKGSVFVDYADEDAAKAFLAIEPKPQWKGHDLKIMSKEAYVNEKNELIRQGKMEPSNSRKKFFEGKTGRGGHSGNSDNWKDRRDQDQRSGHRDSRGRGGGRGRGGDRGGRGRGGRGRGRGGDRGRGGRSFDTGRPPRIIHTTGRKPSGTPPSGDAAGKADAPADSNTNKRGREDDGGAAEPPAKKVQTEAA